MSDRKWMVYSKKADFQAIAQSCGISPVTARIIRNRDVIGEEAVQRYLHGGIQDLHSPYLLKDAGKAAELLLDKIRLGRRIRIIGDYDIDGICSTYLLLQALRRLGAAADYDIPDRIRDGYGINPMMVRKAAEEGIDTILTCDNGIAAKEAMDEAAGLGLTVIITDHHEVPQGDQGDDLPQAAAIVNPKQSDCSYPWKEICGAVVAYKLIQILYEKMAVPREEWLAMIEFAAMATIGDVMKLQDENRILVREGLARMPFTRSEGLKALIRCNDLDIRQLSAYHIGFVVGPCLNASGRLETAKLAMRMLLAEDPEEAAELALRLKELNEERKDMTAKGMEAAFAQVEKGSCGDMVLVVYLPDCHESLAGIIAGKVREHYNRPAIVLTDSRELVKGSGRSIEAYSMYQKLTENKELMVRYGGHPMAAGMSLLPENVERFRKALNEKAGLTEEDCIPKVWIDVPLPFEYVNEALIRELELLEPFGQGNEKPLFAQKDVEIRQLRVMGRNRNAVRMDLVSQWGMPVSAIWFGEGDRFLKEAEGHHKMHVLYYPTIHEYNGIRSIQMTIRDYQLL